MTRASSLSMVRTAFSGMSYDPVNATARSENIRNNSNSSTIRQTRWIVKEEAVRVVQQNFDVHALNGPAKLLDNL